MKRVFMFDLMRLTPTIDSFGLETQCFGKFWRIDCGMDPWNRDQIDIAVERAMNGERISTRARDVA